MGTDTKFLIAKFLLTKLLITKFLITNFLIYEVPNVTKFLMLQIAHLSPKLHLIYLDLNLSKPIARWRYYSPPNILLKN